MGHAHSAWMHTCSAPRTRQPTSDRNQTQNPPIHSQNTFKAIAGDRPAFKGALHELRNLQHIAKMGIPTGATGGCVRMHEDDAQALYEWSKIGDRVVVLASP